MKIGIDVTALIWKSKSGVEWYTRHIVVHLAKLLPDEKVFLYTPRPLPSDFVALLPPRWKVKVLQWPLPFGWIQIRWSLELLLHPVDVYFSPSYIPPIIHPKRTVVTIHDLAVKTDPGIFSCTERLRQQIALWRMVYTTSHICVVSHATKKDLQKYFPKLATPITVTPLGVDQIYFQECSVQKKDEIRKKQHLPQKYFLQLGRVVAKKNPKGAIDLARAYREQTGESVHLVFAGSVSDEYKKELLDFSGKHRMLRSAAGKHSVLGRKDDVEEKKRYIHFLGYVPEEDMPAILQQAMALLFLSHKEGFGLPILQAYASGTPVVRGNDEALKEIAGEHAIVYEQSNLTTTVRIIQNMLSDTIERKKIQQAMRYHSMSYTWKRTAELTLDILK